jgi:SAM-dependent methyltransferase
MPTSESPRDRFLALVRASVQAGAFTKLTLGKCRAADPTLKNVFVRPVVLKAGPRLNFVWRHATQDITKNLPQDEALVLVSDLLGHDFLDGHLFTTTQTAQYEGSSGGEGRLVIKAVFAPPAKPPAHDRARVHPLAHDAPWLRALGVTNDRGQPREGMAAKLRQIQRFTELIGHLLDDAGLAATPSLEVTDMGCGKGYLTFALADLLKGRATVTGIESRPALTELCNRVAREAGFDRLSFAAGDIATTALARVDVLVALHACDTATDDALAKGIAAGASLLVVSPCCQKELRPQLTAPAVLADALRHGIFQERQAEFVTDALRAQLLEWAGYRTKVFEFVSTEHTAKNLMISAIKERPSGDAACAGRIAEFARFYGIRHQRLAGLLGVSLES